MSYVIVWEWIQSNMLSIAGWSVGWYCVVLLSSRVTQFSLLLTFSIGVLVFALSVSCCTRSRVRLGPVK